MLLLQKNKDWVLYKEKKFWKVIVLDAGKSKIGEPHLGEEPVLCNNIVEDIIWWEYLQKQKQ